MAAGGVHGRIVDGLLAAGRQLGYADPYLARILPRHADLAGHPQALVDDWDYTLSADPQAMLEHLPLTAAGPAGSRIRTYRRASHLLTGRTTDERALALQIAATASREVPVPNPGRWQLAWWHGTPPSSLQTLTGHTNRVTTVTVVQVDGQTLLAAASRGATVRLWDPISTESVTTIALPTPAFAIAVGTGTSPALAVGTSASLVMLEHVGAAVDEPSDRIGQDGS